MPQALPVPMNTSARDGKKRRGFEAALSPRASPPTRAPMPERERLPSIRNLLSEYPPQHDPALSQHRTPMKQDATGPRTVIPIRVSPPPTARRYHQDQSYAGSSNGITRTSQNLDRKESNHSSIDSVPRHLPIHSGPPPGRPSYSPSSLGPAPVSPYASSSQDSDREYPNRETQSLPPPPVPYQQSTRNYAASYSHRDEYRNGDTGHKMGHYRDPGSIGPLPSIQPPYASYPPSPYGYPPAATSVNGHYVPHNHQYQNGYPRGSVHFDSDDPNGQTPRRRRGNLPRDTTDVLKAWCSEHLGHPYPTEEEKQMLCRRTGLQMTQISNWFINARRRRIPELVNQATAETRLRENSGESAGSSD